jgi:hypothetical protein
MINNSSAILADDMISILQKGKIEKNYKKILPVLLLFLFTVRQ